MAPKRKRLWIDAPLQSRTLLFVLALVAGSLGLAYLSVDRGLALAAEESRRIFVPVDWARDALGGPFLFTSAIALLAAGVMTLVWSHRLVGPVLVLAAGLRRVRDGDLTTDVRVRDTDSLRDTVADFAAMQDALKRTVAEDRGRLEDLDRRLGELGRRLQSDVAGQREIQALRDELKKVSSFFRL